MIKLIESFGYMICLTMSKFYEFLIIRRMSDNEKTPSLTPTQSFKIRYWYFKFPLDGCLYEHSLTAVIKHKPFSFKYLHSGNILLEDCFKKAVFHFRMSNYASKRSQDIWSYTATTNYEAVNDIHVCKLAD